jgi:hypothetical protein
MFLKAFLHVSMFIHHPQGVSYYVRQRYKINKMETFIQVIVTENQ